MINIESKFIAIDDKTVIEHRRIVTPWFFIRLRPNTYKYIKTMVFVLGGCGTFHGWEKNDDKLLFESTDSELLSSIKEAAIARPFSAPSAAHSES